MDEKIISRLLLHDKVAQKCFLGVFARDEIPAKPPYPSSFVVNTHPRYRPGEHWLAFYYNKNGFCDFFDSFGHSPSYFGFEKYIQATSNGWAFNKKRIQGVSDYCGFYVTLFLLYKSRDKTQLFFRQFGANFFKNDKIITNYLN